MRRLVFALILIGCSPAVRRIDAPRPAASGTSSRTTPPPYVVRLSDGAHTWEVQLPAMASGYEVRIPLADAGGLDATGTQGSARAASPVAPLDAAAPDTDGSTTDAAGYRAAMTRIATLYQRRSYSPALEEVTRLLRAYPRDTRLLAMQGSLYWKLGDKLHAQESWEQVLTLQPDNDSVRAMLEGSP
jgi:Flp pilus assembly protein TadD